MTFLVIGATGKTGRVADRLAALDLPVRLASRSAAQPFDWTDRSTWAPTLTGADAAYITYHPDLAFPGAEDDIQAFTTLAADLGVKHLVLLSGRGEPLAVASERIVQNSGLAWTIVRCAWFMQNFDEGHLAGPVAEGVLALPAKNVGEPFIDVDDIADVAVAALTRPGHHGRLYELTGPRLLTFTDVAAELTQALGREITFLPVTPEEYATAALAQGVPAEEIDGIVSLFTELFDGRNAHLTDGVHQALGRPARDFTDYAKSL